MSEIKEMKNADRFTGFADIYDSARPAMPEFPAEIIERYLGGKAKTVIDLGCGTGLSSLIWLGRAEKIIGVEPSEDMRKIALEKERETLTFIKGFSHDIPLPDSCADAVVCSQSFHWMEPFSSLGEISRILADGGVFATVDCDWPPVSDWRVEKAYQELFNKVREIEGTHTEIKDSFVRYDKNQHLWNIIKSGKFAFAREIVFSSEEKCTADRLIGLALSQGSLQEILKNDKNLIANDVEKFKKIVNDIFGDKEFTIYFSYRMRIGVKKEKLNDN